MTRNLTRGSGFSSPVIAEAGWALSQLRRDQARRLVLANGVARCAIGITALTMPLPLAPWVGGAGTDQAALLLARALAGRGMAILAGTRLTLHRRGASGAGSAPPASPTRKMSS